MGDFFDDVPNGRQALGMLLGAEPVTFSKTALAGGEVTDGSGSRMGDFLRTSRMGGKVERRLSVVLGAGMLIFSGRPKQEASLGVSLGARSR